MLKKEKIFLRFIIATSCIILIFINQKNTIAQNFDIEKSLISLRLKQISNSIELNYNPIIFERIKSEIHNKETAELIGKYLEIKDFLENELTQRSLPNQLLALPLAISQLNSLYFNNLNQAGIWGLNPAVSIKYGLNIDRQIDERYDFYKSTGSALDYFQQLYDETQDYWLSILIFSNSKAAINNLNKSLKNTDNYWYIYQNNLLPNSEIISNFIYYSYLINFYEDHNINPITYIKEETIEIELKDNILITNLLEQLKISKESFRELNPIFISDEIFATTDYSLIIPKQISNKHIDISDTIFFQNIFKKEEESTVLETQIRNTIYYTVKSGDNLGRIASRHNLSVEELKRLNNLKSDIIRPGQRLVVSKHHERPQAPISQNPARVVTDKEEFIYYTVKSGDTLWSIAQKYPGVSDRDIKLLNNIGDTIHAGQKLKIKRK